MKFESLMTKIPSTGLFRTGDILAGEKNPKDVRRQLDRWVKAGKITQLRREVYLLQEPYRAVSPHPFFIANLLRRASYISLQSALSHYGMIPEHVPVVTSVTGGRPEELATPAGRFLFRHIKRSGFFGFREIAIAPDQRVRIATPEKALADLLYLTLGSDQINYLTELRLERPEGFDQTTALEIAGQMRSHKVERALTRLHHLWEEEAAHETLID